MAKLDDEVIGFCRFFHSNQIPKEKINFEYIDGYFCMGMIISESYRRRGVARYLSRIRQNHLYDLGVQNIYSLVAMDNPTSIKMHQDFGFSKIKEGSGFLNIKFDCGSGILFTKKLI